MEMFGNRVVEIPGHDFRVRSDVYNDDAIFAAEMERIFESTWVYVGHESQVPNEGDYYGTTVGTQPILKLGSTGPAVRDLQRTLDAAAHGTDLTVSGIFDRATSDALKAWQQGTQRTRSGVANGSTWMGLQSGERPPS